MTDPTRGTAGSPTATVRVASTDDIEPWLDLFEQVAAEGMWLGSELPLDRDRRSQGLADTIASDSAQLFVAEADGQLVGGLYIGLSPAGHADLGMQVGQGWRGRGVGTALMTAAVSWARAKGAHKIVLEVWPHNEAGIALYRRFGFVVEGRRIRQWRRNSGELWDSISMGLVLDTTSAGSPHLDAAGL